MATRSGEVATQQPWPLAHQHPWPLDHQQSVAPSKWPLTLWGPWPLPPYREQANLLHQSQLNNHHFRFAIRKVNSYSPEHQTGKYRESSSSSTSSLRPQSSLDQLHNCIKTKTWHRDDVDAAVATTATAIDKQLHNRLKKSNSEILYHQSGIGS